MTAVEWMPFFGEDFWQSERVAAMDDSAVLLYSWLLWWQFCNGDLPKPAVLRRLPHRWQGQAFDEIWPQVSGCFEETQAGRLSNPRCRDERERMLAMNKRASERAQKANSRRWGAKKADSVLQGSNKDPSWIHMTETVQERRTETLSDPSDLSLSGTVSAPRRVSPSGRAGDVPPPPSGKTPKTRKPATGPQADCIRHWEQEWARTRGGQAWVWTGKDASLIADARKLARDDLAELQRRATRLLEETEPFTFNNASPGLLVSRWNQLAVDPKPRQTQQQADFSADEHMNAAELIRRQRADYAKYEKAVAAAAAAKGEANGRLRGS